jgi:hypothetical protein
LDICGEFLHKVEHHFRDNGRIFSVLAPWIEELKGVAIAGDPLPGLGCGQSRALGGVKIQQDTFEEV